MSMSGTELVLAWLGIGMCASIAGWVWPFHRGLFGILMNLGVAFAGAVVAGSLAFRLHGGGRSMVTTSFLWAAVGSVGALTALHLVWARRRHARPRSGH